MKKMIVLLLVCAFSTSVFAAWDVYDYRASFKRVNATLRWFNLGAARKRLDTASVVGDSFRGYLAVDQCSNCCDVGGKSFSFDSDNNDPTGSALDPNGTNAIIYLVRGGERIERKARTPIVIRSNANVDYAMFGPRATSDGPLLVGTPNMAWFTMEYDLAVEALINGRGFMGDANTNVLGNRASVAQAGFGSLRQVTTISSCSTGNCMTLVNASGSLVGQFQYTGVCAPDFMFDVCATIDTAVKGVSYAPISGNWAMKYNKAVTSLVSGLSPEVEATFTLPEEDYNPTDTSFDGLIIRRLTGVTNAASAKVTNVKKIKTGSDFFFE